MDLTEQFNSFWEYVEDNEIQIYNEFSLQYELGIYLRSALPPTFKIEFERNICFFREKLPKFPKKSECNENKDDKPNENLFTKHEIDLVIYKNNELNENQIIPHCAIELKYPQNGRIPETMYDCIKDIKFMEELKEVGFENTYCITMVDTYSNNKQKNLFYSFPKIKRKTTTDIYRYFRENVESNECEQIPKEIPKPTGKDKTGKSCSLKGVNYKIEWNHEKTKKWSFYIIEADIEISK